jgi:GAF domain-containing protein
MLELLADFFMEAVSVEACTISMLDVTRNYLIVMLDRDPVPASREAPGTSYRITEFPYLQAFLEKQQTLIVQRDAPDLPPMVASNMDSFFWKSVLMIPLLAGSEVIGVVELPEQRARRDFSPAEIRLAESLAHQAAGALQNARLFDKVNRRVQELAALNRIAYRVSGAHSLAELGAVIEEETLLLLPSEIFFFALYDAARNRVFFERLLEDGQHLMPFEWELQPSLTRYVIQNKRTLRLNDQFSEVPEDNAPQYYGEGEEHRSWLGAPMRMGERVIGVIAVESMRSHAYGDAEEQLLQTIADQVAVAVERVRQTA